MILFVEIYELLDLPNNEAPGSENENEATGAPGSEKENEEHQPKIRVIL